MNANKILIMALLSVATLVMFSCRKYLETKSVQELSTPETLDDLQQMLDNPSLVNGLLMDNTATDEIYIDAAIWSAIPEIYSLGYVWDSQVNNNDDWINMYKIVYYANNVLHNLDLVDAKGQEQRKNNIRGSALFMRAHAFYQVAKLYAPQFDPITSSSDLGIPLRLNADINEPSIRASVKQSYDRIIADLETALTLLPTSTTLKIRPDKTACNGLLARIYLQIGDYEKAKEKADQYLQVKNILIDYNTLNPSIQYPFGDYRNNPEVVYYFHSQSGLSGVEGVAIVDTSLYKSFQSNDLRKSLFFVDIGGGSYSFRGKYTGNAALFTGIATDEIILIRAECNARLGSTSEAMQDLNNLLSKRHDASFVPLTATSAEDALILILQERRKQLLTRGLRWADLKRLNKESRFAVTLTRVLGSQTYTLPPNDKRYTFLIPIEVMNQSNMEQNPR